MLLLNDMLLLWLPMLSTEAETNVKSKMVCLNMTCHKYPVIFQVCGSSLKNSSLPKTCAKIHLKHHRKPSMCCAR